MRAPATCRTHFVSPGSDCVGLPAGAAARERPHGVSFRYGKTGCAYSQWRLSPPFRRRRIQYYAGYQTDLRTAQNAAGRVPVPRITYSTVCSVWTLPNGLP